VIVTVAWEAGVKNRAHLASVIILLTLLVAGIGFGCAGHDSQLTASPTSLNRAVEEGQTIALPAPRVEGSVSLEEAIAERRSGREFTDEPLSMAELGQLLWAAQGITSPQGGRATPSAGATYPLEIYVLCAEVTGVAPGVYHYRPATHDLLSVIGGDVRTSLCTASLEQQWVEKAPVDIILAAVYERTTERYGERGIRYVHLEAGHAAQNLCLQATSLGLGAVTVGAFSDDEVQALLHLAHDEEPLYVIPVGRPASP
jgi:SagB-type dehydrogenase family enzyme